MFMKIFQQQSSSSTIEEKRKGQSTVYIAKGEHIYVCVFISSINNYSFHNIANASITNWCCNR
jgi:hypothetical protein